MKMYFARLVLPCLLFSVCFHIPAAARNHPDGVAAASENPEIIRAKREILRLLLTEIFRGETVEEIYLLTKDIPAEIQNEFPPIENLRVRFISAEEAAEQQLCPFELWRFAISKNTATVLFGDCREGLGYNFEKVHGKWQFAPLFIEH